MAGSLRAVAFLLSAGCVLTSALSINSQNQISGYCSRAPQTKLSRAKLQPRLQIPARIEAVTFTGNIHMPVEEQEQISEVLKQRSWTSDPKLTELNNVAAEVARQQWQEHGYFKANTKPTAVLLTSNLSELTAAVTFYIEEGPLYRLDDITFKHVTVFPQERVRALFPMQSGDVFNTDKVRIGLDALRSLYGTRGYINFTSVPDTQVDEANRSVSLVIDVEQGKQFRVAKTNVIGLETRLAARIARNWPLKPGDVYNAALAYRFLEKNAPLVPPGLEPHIIIHGWNEPQGALVLTLAFTLCE
jgi:outer membrane protein assembly factor BamA